MKSPDIEFIELIYDDMHLLSNILLLRFLNRHVCILQILKGSCFMCHRLSIRSVDALVFTKKLELLDQGLFAAISDLNELVCNLTLEIQDDSEREGVITEKVQQFVEQCIKGLYRHHF